MEGHGVHLVGSLEEFNILIQTAGQKLVVVDFFAIWCGPCRRISPEVEELASSYPNVVFLKVDVDASPDISGSCGVSSMPTFHFYQNGQLVDKFSGADSARLRSTVSLYAGTYKEEEQAPKFQSSFFPLKGYLTFGGTDKMDPVVKKALEFNQALKDKNGWMEADQIDTFKKVVAIVEDSGRYHVTTFEDQQLELIANVISSWPLENKFPVLDVLRRLVLHPAAAKYYSQRRKEEATKGNVIGTMLQLLSDSAGNLGSALMTLRFFANLFQFLDGRDIVLSPGVSLWVLPCLQNYINHTNAQIHIAAATVLANYAIALSQSNAEGKEEAFAILQEYIVAEKVEEAKLRLVSGLATMLYHDQSLKAAFKEKADSVLAETKEKEGDGKVTAAIADLKAFLAS